MGGKYTEAQKKASLKYQSDKAQIKLTVAPEQHQRYHQHAQKKGISLTKLIVSLLEKDIEETNY